MSELIQAAESVKKLARMYESMVVVATALERIGSVEQAEQEAKTRLASIRSGIEAAKEEEAQIILDNEKATVLISRKLDDANEQAESIISGAAARRDELIEQARDEAGRMTEAANVRASEIATQARHAAENTVANAVQRKVGIEKELVELNAETARLNNQIGELENVRDERTKELRQIEAKIAAAKAKAAEMLS